MDPIELLSDDERRVIAYLAACFEKGRREIHASGVHNELGMDLETFKRAILRVRELGVVETHERRSNGDAMMMLSPTPHCVTVHREILRRQKSTPDVVDAIVRRLRTNPKTAWPIAIILGLAVVVSLIMGILSLIDRLL